MEIERLQQHIHDLEQWKYHAEESLHRFRKDCMQWQAAAALGAVTKRLDQAQQRAVRREPLAAGVTKLRATGAAREVLSLVLHVWSGRVPLMCHIGHLREVVGSGCVWARRTNALAVTFASWVGGDRDGNV